jgi:hypothetical protein
MNLILELRREKRPARRGSAVRDFLRGGISEF